MDEKIRLRKDYQKLLKNFLPDEFKKTFINLFGLETWNSILKMFKNKGKLSKLEITRATAFGVQKAEDGPAVSTRTIGLPSTVSNKRTWYAFQLCGEGNNAILSERGVKEEFLHSTKQIKVPYDIKVKMHEEIVWIRLSSLTSKVSNTVYLAYFSGEGIILSSRRGINLKLMQVIASALKFETLKKLSLEGRDVRSLLRMIKQKDCKAPGKTGMEKKYENQGLSQNCFCVDYTRQKFRKAAMKNCLGDNPPVLQSLTIKSHSGLRVKRYIPEMEGFPAKATLRFRNPDLAKFLAELAEKNIIVEPLPHYLRSFPVTGKNTIYLKDASVKHKK